MNLQVLKVNGYYKWTIIYIAVVVTLILVLSAMGVR